MNYEEFLKNKFKEKIDTGFDVAVKNCKNAMLAHSQLQLI